MTGILTAIYDRRNKQKRYSHAIINKHPAFESTYYKINCLIFAYYAKIFAYSIIKKFLITSNNK